MKITSFPQDVHPGSRFLANSSNFRPCLMQYLSSISAISIIIKINYYTLQIINTVAKIQDEKIFCVLCIINNYGIGNWVVHGMGKHPPPDTILHRVYLPPR